MATMNERDWGLGNPVWEDFEQERRGGLEREAKVRHTTLDNYLPDNEEHEEFIEALEATEDERWRR